MTDRAYVVVPFERVGITIGPRQAYMFDAIAKARLAAAQIAPRVAGVAILEREVDPETGDDRDTLIAGFGAIPPRFPTGIDWTLRLN
ncbi:MAG: hypothetical protein SFW09_21080 [Hyphomicrobiaceae bacterium]|nr:hypothetical protein [Hyphomicrobiaceae bacterium]